MNEFRVFTTRGPMRISASSQVEASKLAIKDGHKLSPVELWLQALEGDEFKQTKEVLDNGNGEYCCLGVGCVLAERAGVPVTRVAGRIVGGALENQPPVQAWLGLRTASGSTKKKHGLAEFLDPNQLTNLNDKGHSFKEIAQTIRANPENYFVNC